MKYLSTDGHVYIALNATELVSKMHDASYAPAEDDETWMKQTAERAAEMAGQPVRAGSAAEFVADLVKIGFLKEEPNE